MRCHSRLTAVLAVLAAATLAAASAAAQQPLPSRPTDPASPVAPVPDSIRTALQRLLERGDLGAIPSIGRVVPGPARIAVGDTVDGSLIVHGGSLELDGVVHGSVAVVGGDLIIGDGAFIDGSASAVGGTVRVTGGRVTGDIRSTSVGGEGALAPAQALDPRSVRVVGADPATTTWRALRLVLASFGIFLVLGVGLLLFSQPTFDAVVQALEDRFARSFWIGLLAQFAILPVLLLLTVGLAISLVGILLIPFAVVAYVIAIVGLLALGFLAAARISGGVFGIGAGVSRAGRLREMVLGLALHCALWLLAAGFSWHPLAGLALRSIALAVTWVAITLGLGAIIAAGLAARRARAGAHLPRAQADPMAWQTPTPITGVVAARRPLSPTREAS